MEDRKRQNPNDPLTAYDLPRQVNEQAAELFLCPSDTKVEVVDDFGALAAASGLVASNYFAVAGSAFSRKTDPTNVLNPKYPNDEFLGNDSGAGAVNLDGIMHVVSKTRTGKITDGLSKTLLLGERWYQLRAWTVGAFYAGVFLKKDAAGHPIAPTEPVVQTSYNSTKNIDARYPPNVNLAGNTCYELHKPHQRPQNCAPGTTRYNNLMWGSFHSGGAHFAYADGSVDFIGDDISPQVWVVKASRNGDETVNE